VPGSPLGATLNFLERLVDKFIHHVLIMACSITNELLANCTNLLRSRATSVEPHCDTFSISGDPDDRYGALVFKRAGIGARLHSN
jgi:hypothetical protein